MPAALRATTHYRSLLPWLRDSTTLSSVLPMVPRPCSSHMPLPSAQYGRLPTAFLDKWHCQGQVQLRWKWKLELKTGNKIVKVSIHGGTVFSLLALLTVSLIMGWVMEKLHMPPLLGMLLTGTFHQLMPPLLLFQVSRSRISPTLTWHGGLTQNGTLQLAPLPWYLETNIFKGAEIFQRWWFCYVPALVWALRHWKSCQRWCSDLPSCPASPSPLQARRPPPSHSSPVALAARVLLGLPWQWGFMLGFVLAAVSPAVVVSCLLNLQERGYGVTKGIPTLVIAAGDNLMVLQGYLLCSFHGWCLGHLLLHPSSWSHLQ